jgi:transposase
VPTKTTPAITSPYAPDLDKVRAWIEQMIKTLQFVELVAALLAFFGRMRDANTELLRQLAHLRRKRPRSETLARLERQLVLPFIVVVKAVPKKKRAPGSGGRHTPPARLPRTEQINAVPPEMRVCPLCGAEMTTVGHSRCEYIDVVPAKYFVSVRKDETVACPKDNTIVSAPVPPAIVERGTLGDTLIVESLADKFLEYQPIERQCARFARIGVPIAPQTLARSVNAAIDLLAPVAKMIEAQTRAPGLLGTDATSIAILDREAREGIRTGAMWCWTNARWITFFYAQSADSESVRRFLGDDLARTVQCDGTSTLTFLEKNGGKRPGCWSHGRRRFVEAARLGDALALDALKLIAPIFRVERQSQLAGDSADTRRRRRQAETRPIIDKLREWLDDKRATTPPKTPLGRALGYLHRQWPRLVLFLDDGNIEVTNNRRERELRRLVLGRKNWLFAWLDTGGERVAHILTIVATCIAHDIDPRAYLHIATKLIVRGWLQSKLRDLLPDRIALTHPELFVGSSSASLLGA